VELELTAEWVAPSIARDRVRRWLTAHRWSPAQVDDLVLAVSEAVSNSVEHGYGMPTEDADHSTLDASSSTVKLAGQIITDADGIRRVEFTIRDHGRWTPPDGPSSRGHGMTLMRACTDAVTIEHTTAGTTVVLRSRALPSPPGHRGARGIGLT
jgi:anti-sigma regulatory factor (Ser/Thr protein kinase)